MIDIINDLSNHLGMNRKNLSNCIKPKAIRNQSTEITESWALKVKSELPSLHVWKFLRQLSILTNWLFSRWPVLKLKYELEWFIFYLKVSPDHVDFKIWNTSWNDILEALSLLSIQFTSESVNQSFFMQWRISAKVVRAHPLVLNNPHCSRCMINLLMSFVLSV